MLKGLLSCKVNVRLLTSISVTYFFNLFFLLSMRQEIARLTPEEVEAMVEEAFVLCK